MLRTPHRHYPIGKNVSAKEVRELNIERDESMATGTTSSSRTRKRRPADLAIRAPLQRIATRRERVLCDAEGRLGIMLSKLWRMCRLAKLGRKIDGMSLATRSQVTS